jgi:hypothetical protein
MPSQPSFPRDFAVEVGISGMTFDHKPTEVEYQQLWKSFENVEAEPDELLEEIVEGHAFSPVFGQPRRLDNWKSCQFVGVDLEKHTDAALDVACTHPFYKMYGAFAYSTLSHTWDAPRSRLVFLLDRPVLDKETWHWGALAVCEMWGMASDVAAADRGRAFLGSPGAMVHVNGRVLRTSTLLQLSHQRERHHVQSQEARRAEYQRRHSEDENARFSDVNAAAFMQSMCDRVARTQAGNRNNTLNRSSFIVGKWLVRVGKLGEAEAISALVNAAVTSGLSYEESFKTVTVAVQRGAGS